ncbi:MAG: glutamate--tRNA ligase, partial [Blastocatellia bacterium]
FDEAGVNKNLKKDAALKTLLPEMADRFAVLDSFTHESTEAALRALAEERGVKAGLLINGARVALTGQPVGPGIFHVITAIGQRRAVQRLRHAATLV